MTRVLTAPGLHSSGLNIGKPSEKRGMITTN